MPQLASHGLEVALLQPQIAPNTGNIARLCVATNTQLHLIRPMGFVISDKMLRRSAMDYWARLRLTVHDDSDSFFADIASRRYWLFSTKGTKSHWHAEFADGDFLIFGNESHGIAQSILTKHADRTLRIPQAPAERCLNVSTAVGIGLYEALRQVGADT